MTDASEECTKLKPKQELFCQEYVTDFDGERALKECGYDTKTKGSIRVQVHRMLTNANISRRIDELLEERMKILGMKSAELLYKTSILARGNLAKFNIGPDGKITMKDGSAPTDEDLYPIEEIVIKSKVVEDAVITGEGQLLAVDAKIIETKIKLSSRLQALTLVGKHKDVGAYVNKHEHTGKDGKPLAIGYATLSDEELDEEIAKFK